VAKVQRTVEPYREKISSAKQGYSYVIARIIIPQILTKKMINDTIMKYYVLNSEDKVNQEKLIRLDLLIYRLKVKEKFGELYQCDRLQTTGWLKLI
jgi:hypothetical protein